MQKPALILLIATLAFCFTGCSYTSVGGGLNRTSPNGKYELGIEVDGAYRHAYVDKTKKTVWVWINDVSTANHIELFKHSYILTGSDIDWQTHWSSNEVVSIELYDWGDDVSNYNNMKHMTASNHIATLSFVSDKATGKFVEQK